MFQLKKAFRPHYGICKFLRLAWRFNDSFDHWFLSGRLIYIFKLLFTSLLIESGEFYIYLQRLLCIKLTDKLFNSQYSMGIIQSEWVPCWLIVNDWNIKQIKIGQIVHKAQTRHIGGTQSRLILFFFLRENCVSISKLLPYQNIAD